MGTKAFLHHGQVRSLNPKGLMRTFTTVRPCSLVPHSDTVSQIFKLNPQLQFLFQRWDEMRKHCSDWISWTMSNSITITGTGVKAYMRQIDHALSDASSFRVVILFQQGLVCENILVDGKKREYRGLRTLQIRATLLRFIAEKLTPKVCTDAAELL